MKAKKSYGQHFLTNERIAERIAKSLKCYNAYDQVLEVGPGKGMLTKYLLRGPHEVYAVDADRDMIAYMYEHYPELRDRLICGNFLRVPLQNYLGETPFAIIGNFPYNISSQILLRTVEYRDQVPELVGMFQKEVAERVVAGPGSKTYGVISVLTQAWYDGELLFQVKAGNFNPPPKVQSAVIRLTRRHQTDLGCDPKLFRRVVKQAFGQRRKMLRNTMKSLLEGSALLHEPLFTQRPEKLSVADFVELTNLVAQHQASASEADGTSSAP